jgi:hypothetical protein
MGLVYEFMKHKECSIPDLDNYIGPLVSDQAIKCIQKYVKMII